MVGRADEVWSVQPGHGEGESWCMKKKTREKALIPLPPTGLVSFFCANPDVVKTHLQPRRAVGLCRGSVISQNAKF